MTLQATVLRYGKVWCDLPPRLRVAVWLAAPLAVVSLLAGFLYALHLRLFPLISITGSVLVVLAIAGLLESLMHSILLHSIGALADDTKELGRGELVSKTQPANPDLVRVWDKVQLASSLLDQHRRAAEIADNRAARMFEESPLACLQTDSQGIVQRVNRAAVSLLGRPATELETQSISAILGPVSPECEKEYIRPDGRRLLLSIRGETGDYALMDISERLLAMETMAQCAREINAKNEEVAKASARVAEAEAAEARFLSGMSNEWRVPLNAVLGFTELMLDGRIGPVSSEQSECLVEILESGRQILQLMNARMERAKTGSAGPPESATQVTDVETVVQEVLRSLEAQSAENRRTRIAIQMDPAIAKISTDGAHLKPVAQAYLTSAVKLSPKSGRITVRTAPEGRNAFRLEVEYKVMAGYYKAGEPPPGSDATLALAREIVEPLGGRVGVRQLKGRSMILFAEFPIRRRPAIDAAAEEIYDWEHQVLDFRRGHSPAIANGRKNGNQIFALRPEDLDRSRNSFERAILAPDVSRTVLVFGNNLNLLQKLSCLTGPGHKLISVRDVRMVLKDVAQWEPFAILLDLSTSGSDALEFVEAELRSAGLSIPVIGFLNRDPAPGDCTQLHPEPLGLMELGERDPNLAAVCKALA